jgi:hypothetical protein
MVDWAKGRAKGSPGFGQMHSSSNKVEVLGKQFSMGMPKLAEG